MHCRTAWLGFHPPVHPVKCHQRYTVHERALYFNSTLLFFPLSSSLQHSYRSLHSTMCERVNVIVRFRPLNNEEREKDGGRTPFSVRENEISLLANAKRFTFDHAFTPTTSQAEVYEKVGEPVVASVLAGYNGTVLAYGQTGSGKTYTMTGPGGGQTLFAPSNPSYSIENDAELGLVTRILHSLFASLCALPAAEATYSVHITVAELFKENLRDLLHGGEHTETFQRELRIREDRTSGKGVYIEGITEERVETYREAVAAVSRGMDKKNIASTGANETSSRSHTIVTLLVTQTNHVKEDTKTVGRLNLVDLAGSERVEKTGAEGERLKEAQTINLSLSLLGNVINKLTDGKSVHIPYRDSKLTRILQDSFGGNSRTTLFCCCSLSELHTSETTSTLMFANRAKQIKNKPRVNKELFGADLQVAYQKAQEEIVQLKIRIAALEEACGGHSLPLRKSSFSLSKDDPESEAASCDLGNELHSVLKELKETKEELEEAENERSSQKERTAFYEKREHDAMQKVADWKLKHDREKKAADSWLRKYNDVLKENEAKLKKPPAKKAPLTKKGSVVKRRSSVVPSCAPSPAMRSQKADSTCSVSTPQTPGSACSLDQLSEMLSEAKHNESMFLVKERELQGNLEDSLEKLNTSTDTIKAMEKRHAEQNVTIISLEAKFESLSAEFDQRAKMQDKEVSMLLTKLDTLRTQHQREKEEREKDKEFAFQPKGDTGGMTQLEHENKLLYEQNKENAERLVALTRQKEEVARQVKTLHDDRKKLVHEIELSNISSELKNRILGEKIRATKAAFQNRLLQCFSDES